MTFFKRLCSDKRGATAIEYGLIVALLAIAMITAARSMGNELSTTFNKVGTTMSNGNTAA